jgi:hypothetical protein
MASASGLPFSAVIVVGVVVVAGVVVVGWAMIVPEAVPEAEPGVTAGATGWAPFAGVPPPPEVPDAPAVPDALDAPVAGSVNAGWSAPMLTCPLGDSRAAGIVTVARMPASCGFALIDCGLIWDMGWGGSMRGGIEVGASGGGRMHVSTSQ